VRYHDKTFHIRFTEKEYERLCKYSEKAGLPKTTYIRHMINGCRPKEHPPIDFWDFMRALQRVGSNLNQATNLAHKFGSFHAEKLDSVLKEYRDFSMAIFDRMVSLDDLDVSATLENGRKIAEIEKQDYENRRSVDYES